MANIYEIRKEFQYNLKSLPSVIQSMISKLVDESEDIWKLLNDNTRDALSQSDLDIDTKYGLIEFDSDLDVSTSPFKLVPYMAVQTLQNETTEIRMYPFNTIFHESGIWVTQAIRIELITHYNNFLIDGGYRLEILKQEIIKVLNNFNYDDADGVQGAFTFDNSTARLQYYADGYLGYVLELSGDIK